MMISYDTSCYSVVVCYDRCYSHVYTLRTVFSVYWDQFVLVHVDPGVTSLGSLIPFHPPVDHVDVSHLVSSMYLLLYHPYQDSHLVSHQMLRLLVFVVAASVYYLYHLYYCCCCCCCCCCSYSWMLKIDRIVLMVRSQQMMIGSYVY